jgi:hypothetical protein
VITFLGPFMWGLDTEALTTVVYKCFGLSFSLSVDHFIFRAALDRRTEWRDQRNFLPEITELFSPVKRLNKPGEVLRW